MNLVGAERTTPSAKEKKKHQRRNEKRTEREGIREEEK